MKLTLSAILILTTLLVLLDYPPPIAPQAPPVALAAEWGQMPLTFIANQG